MVNRLGMIGSSNAALPSTWLKLKFVGRAGMGTVTVPPSRIRSRGRWLVWLTPADGSGSAPTGAGDRPEVQPAVTSTSSAVASWTVLIGPPERAWRRHRGSWGKYRPRLGALLSDSRQWGLPGQADLVGDHRRLGTPGGADLGKQAGHVHVDGPSADPQGRGDLPVGGALGQQPQHIEFSRGQP